MRMFQALLPAIVIIGAWELGAWFAFDPRFIGQPSEILRYLFEEVRRGEIWADAAITFWEIMLGYVIGAVAGGAVGFALVFVRVWPGLSSLTSWSSARSRRSQSPRSSSSRSASAPSRKSRSSSRWCSS